MHVKDFVKALSTHIFFREDYTFIRIFFEGVREGEAKIKHVTIIHFATTNSACGLFNIFGQGSYCIADIKVLFLAAKKNTLKATETEMFFVQILP